MIILSAPEFADGELLSAHKLNQLSDSVNAVIGATLAPTGIFCTRGVNQTWYMLRRYRYLHVAYSVTLHDSDPLDVSIDFGTGGGGDYTHGSNVSWQWRTYDLNTVGGVAVGAWYSITVTRAGNNFDFSTDMIRESESSNPADVGSYVAPPTWASGEAVGATKLNALSAGVQRFASVVRTPSAVALRAEDTCTFGLCRRQRYLEIRITVTGEATDIDLYVNATKVVNNATTGTHTIDLASVSGGPAVLAWYTVGLIKTSGTVILNGLRELPDAVTAYAPAWAHGDSGFLSELNSYATLLDEAQVVLGLVGWQVAAIHRPYDHPRWAVFKTQRYLKYMRNGSTAASIIDPSGENDSIGLKRTSNAEPFASYDLDSIDWLAPGGLFYVEEADVVWMSDEP